MKWLSVVGLGLLVIAATVSLAAEPYRTTHELVAETSKLSDEEKTRLRKARALLDSIVFPEVSLSDVTYREAIDWISLNARKHMPGAGEGRGIGMVFRARGGEDERMTIKLRAASLPQVLDAICAPHDYLWSVESFAIGIVPREAVGR